jgi:hypothetical protein
MRVPPTVEGYENTDISLAREALIARHNMRMARLADPSFNGFAAIRSALAPIAEAPGKEGR